MIEIKNLNKAYNLGEENGCEVLKGINLTIHDGEMTAIMGASGAGKSTLLHILSCIDQYDNGEYLLDGELIGRMGDARMAEIRNEKMGIVMQDFALIEDFTALENVMMPLDFSAKKRRKKEKRNMALEALEAVSMKEYAGKPVCKLSGGQKQRVAIARGLVNRPEILFADEPTGNLDEENTIRIMQLLRAFSEKALVVLVSHEQNMVKGFADRIIHLEEGRIVSDMENNAAEQIRRMEWKDIYLGEYRRTQQKLEHLQVQFYEQEEEMQEETEQENIAQENTIQIIHRNHKFFVKGTGEEEIILLKDSDCKVVDGPRPEYMDALDGQEIGLESISQAFRQHYRLPELLKVSAGLSEGHGRWLFMRLTLLLFTVVTFLIFTDYRSRDSLNKLALQTTDSHLVTFDFSQGGFTRSGIELFYDQYLTAGGYSDIMPALNDTMNVQYDGYLQLSGHLCKVQDFSMISVKEISTADIQYGRMPKNRNEIVVDRWLLKRARQDNNILWELFLDDKQFLGQKVSFVTGNPVTIVGIGSRDEPSVYGSDTLRLSMAYELPSLITAEEISALYPKKYKDLYLNSNEVFVSERILAQAEGASDKEKKETILKTLKDLTGWECYIAGTFSEEGYDYIIPEEFCYDISREKAIQDHKCYAYAESPQKMIAQIRKDMERGKDKFPVVMQQTTQEQFQKALEEKHSMIQMDYEYLIAFVAVVFVVILVLIWFQILSQRKEMIVSQFVGIRRSVLWRMKMLYALRNTSFVCLPVVMICWIVVQIMSSIPSFNYFVDMTWWVALLFGGVLTGLVTVAYGAVWKCNLPGFPLRYTE